MISLSLGLPGITACAPDFNLARKPLSVAKVRPFFCLSGPWQAVQCSANKGWISREKSTWE